MKVRFELALVVVEDDDEDVVIDNCEDELSMLVYGCIGAPDEEILTEFAEVVKESIVELFDGDDRLDFEVQVEGGSLH